MKNLDRIVLCMVGVMTIANGVFITNLYMQKGIKEAVSRGFDKGLKRVTQLESKPKPNPKPKPKPHKGMPDESCLRIAQNSYTKEYAVQYKRDDGSWGTHLSTFKHRSEAVRHMLDICLPHHQKIWKERQGGWEIEKRLDKK